MTLNELKMSKWMPTRKVWQGGLVALATFFLIRALEQVVPTLVVDVEFEAAIALFVAKIYEYLIPPAWKDRVQAVDAQLVEAVRVTGGNPEVMKAITTPDQLRKLPAIILTIVMAGMTIMACTPGRASPETQLLLACQSFTDTLRTLEPFKPKMDETQISVVNASIATAKPICLGEGPIDVRLALDAVRARLRELVVLQNQVQS